MSSNIGLGKNSNTILVKQVGQQGNNKDASVWENIITNIGPSEMSSESSLSSTTTPNFEIPIYFNGPGLSYKYHKTNKIRDTNRLNEVNNFERSSGSDEGYQLGEFSRLSRSISEDGLNLVDSTGGSNERNEKGLRKEYSGKIGESETYGVDKLDNYRGINHKSRKNKFFETGGSTEFSFEAGKRAKQGFIGEGETKQFGELSRDGGGKTRIGNGEDKKVGRDRGFSASVGSIQFSRKNDGRAGGSGGEDERNREFSRSNGPIWFGRKNRDGRAGRLGGGKEGDIRVGRSIGSMRFGRKSGGRTGGSDGKEGGNRGLSRSNGSIRFSRKNKSGTGRLSVEEEGDIEVGRSIGSMRFGREGGLSGEKEEEGRGFSGSVGSIRLGRINMSGTGGSSEENIKFGEGQRTHRSSTSRGIGKINGSGGKRTFGGSVRSITFGKESGDKGQSKSNSFNTNRTDGNYGDGKSDRYIEGNGYSREYGTGEESDGAAFGEFRPEMGEKLKWDD